MPAGVGILIKQTVNKSSAVGDPHVVLPYSKTLVSENREVEGDQDEFCPEHYLFEFRASLASPPIVIH